MSDLPKVVHHVAGRPIVSWVVDAVREAGASKIVLIVGHGADAVHEVFAGDDAELEFVVQSDQLGTGHATMCAREALSDFDGDVLVLAGDGPLIRASTIHAMLQKHRDTNAAATLATAVISDPTGYGRIVRDGDGRYQAIVEHKNASPEQRRICEIYPSYACFDCSRLFEMLSELTVDDVSGEYYLTDIPAMMVSHGHRVELVDAVPPDDVLSINDHTQLAEVDAILSSRLAQTTKEAY